MGLIQAYESSFKRYDRLTAQILLDHDDLANRQRYLNARSALQTLINFNVIPIVNENDTVVTDEIRFGDNDNLAALVANLIDADLLVILTDKDGLYSANPDRDASATLISEAMASDTSLDAWPGIAVVAWVAVVWSPNYWPLAGGTLRLQHCYCRWPQQ